MKKVFFHIKKYKEILLLLVLTLLFFHKLFIHPTEMIYPAFDLATYSAKKHFLVEQIKNHHELPLWNPYMFGGASFVGSTEIPIFYPPHILFFFFPIELTFGYMFMVDIFLAGLFTYLFTQEIGLQKFASLISSIIMMFSGSTILYIYPGHLSILDGIIWLPLLLLAYEKLVKTARKIYVIFSGVVIALALLSGTLQIAFFDILVGAAFFIYRSLRGNKIYVLYSLALGVCLAAIQLIPNFEFARLSVRSGGLSYSFASDFSLHPYQFITALLPHFFGSPLVANTYWGMNGNFWSLCFYVGILPLILSFFAVVKQRNKYTIFFLLLAVFSLLYAIGRFGFLYPFFYHHVAGFNFFRVPARALYIYGFSIAILSGFGAQALCSKKNFKKDQRFWRFIFASLAVFSFLAVLFSLWLSLHQNTLVDLLQSKGYAIGNNRPAIYFLILEDLRTFCILLFCSAFLIWIATKKIISKTFPRLLIILFILSDLWLFDIKFYQTKKTDEVFKTPLVIKILKKDPEKFRVFDSSGKLFPALGRNHVETLTGFDAMYLKDYRDFLWLAGDHAYTPYESFFSFHSIHNTLVLKLLNTKDVITNNSLPQPFLPKTKHRDFSIYRLDNTLPRAYIVPNAKVLPIRSAILRSIKEQTFNPQNTVLLEKNPGVPLKNNSSYQTAAITGYKPNSIMLSINLSDPGFLVLSEVWYPGWNAYVNGEKTEIYKADFILRSLYLKKGKNDIVFRYEPVSFKIGEIISTISAAIILLVFVLYKRRKI